MKSCSFWDVFFHYEIIENLVVLVWSINNACTFLHTFGHFYLSFYFSLHLIPYIWSFLRSSYISFLCSFQSRYSNSTDKWGFQVSVAPGGRWNRFKTYSTIQRTLEIWGFVFTFIIKAWLNNQKFTYRGEPFCNINAKHNPKICPLDFMMLLDDRNFRLISWSFICF